MFLYSLTRFNMTYVIINKIIKQFLLIISILAKMTYAKIVAQIYIVEC